MVNITSKFKNIKYTENGDISYSTTGDSLVDLLFFAPSLKRDGSKLNELSNKALRDYPEIFPLFAAFMRDPRYGMGWKNVGRTLLTLVDFDPAFVAKVGRFDDIWRIALSSDEKKRDIYLQYLLEQLYGGNQLAKKWMPRFGSKDKEAAYLLSNMFGLTKKGYNHLIKADTVERFLTERTTHKIDFEKVPSLAAIKYHNRFLNGEDTCERFMEYINDVKNGVKKLNVSTTTPYDIYKNRHKIDAQLFFDQLPKISLNCMCVVDTSGSMNDECDSIGKALSIAHYLSLCSTYENGKVISFSSNPMLIDLYQDQPMPEKYERVRNHYFGEKGIFGGGMNSESEYIKQISRMYTGDCSNTDLAKVMDLLKEVDDLPEYLIVLSDMQFDSGSNSSKEELMKIWKSKGYKTKIVWWNFNERKSSTAPEMDEWGNIFMSGYNPTLLQYCNSGFDAKKFVINLLDEYSHKLLHTN